ncbi:sortilin-related receptor-like isoform X1 [Aphis craccivora]|uniref:Sortilin-related receptor-like isoform X1 n=1 Tax=Aphis craccivora TaxID=307492 RepID=A0A6G0ZKX3_APHCR|nr:sortilin-related receptor-like isoform X1 [Aphis craccivora]
MKTVLLYVCAALAVSGVWSLSVYTDDDRNARVPQPFAEHVDDYGPSSSRTKREVSTVPPPPSILPGVSDGNLTSKVSVLRLANHCLVVSVRANGVAVVVNVHSTATHSLRRELRRFNTNRFR